MTLHFDVYNPLSDRKDGKYPVTPEVAIRLSMYKTLPGGQIIIGPALATESEIDEAVNRLTDELREIGKQAKKELKAAHKKQLGE